MPITFGAAVTSVLLGAAGGLLAHEGIRMREKAAEKGPPQLPPGPSAGALPPGPPPAGVKGADAVEGELIGCAVCGDVGCGCGVSGEEMVGEVISGADGVGLALPFRFVTEGGIPVREKGTGWAIKLRRVEDEHAAPPGAPPVPPGGSAAPAPPPALVAAAAPPPPAPKPGAAPPNVKGWDIVGAWGDQFFQIAKAAGGGALNVVMPGAGTAAEALADATKDKIDHETGHNPNAGPNPESALPGATHTKIVATGPGSAAVITPGAPVTGGGGAPAQPAQPMQPGYMGWRGEHVWCGGAPGWVNVHRDAVQGAEVTSGAELEGADIISGAEEIVAGEDFGGDDLGRAPIPRDFGATRGPMGALHWPSHKARVEFERALAAWQAGGGGGDFEVVEEVRDGRRVRVRRPRRHHHHAHHHHAPHHHKPAHHAHHQRHHAGHHRGVRGIDEVQGEVMATNVGNEDVGAVYYLPGRPVPAQYGAVPIGGGQYRWPNQTALDAFRRALGHYNLAVQRWNAQRNARQPVGQPYRPKRIAASLGSLEHERNGRIKAENTLNHCRHVSYQRRVRINHLNLQVQDLQAKLTWCTQALQACRAQGSRLDPSMFNTPDPGSGLPDVAYNPMQDDGSYAVQQDQGDASYDGPDDSDSDGDDGGGDDTSGAITSDVRGAAGVGGTDNLGRSPEQLAVMSERRVQRAGGGQEIVEEVLERGPHGGVHVEEVIKRLPPKHRINRHVQEIRHLQHAIGEVRSMREHEAEHVEHLRHGVHALEHEIERAMRLLGHENKSAYWHLLFFPREGVAGAEGMDGLGEVVEVIEPGPGEHHHKHHKHHHHYAQTIAHLKFLLGEEEGRLEVDRRHADHLLHGIHALEHLMSWGEHFFHDKNERLNARVQAQRVSDGTAGVSGEHGKGAEQGRGGGEGDVGRWAGGGRYVNTGAMRGGGYGQGPYARAYGAPVGYGSMGPGFVEVGWDPLFPADDLSGKKGGDAQDGTAGAERDDLGGCASGACAVPPLVKRYVDPLHRFRPGSGGGGRGWGSDGIN